MHIKNKTKNLYLHIGAHKTASSLLQTILRANAKALIKNNVCLINDYDISTTSFYQELQNINQGKKNDTEISKKAEGSFRKAIEGCKGDILISSENLLASLNLEDFYPNISYALEYIKNIAKDYNIKVIFYVRKQVDFTESTFMQFIHLSIDKEFDDFIGNDIPLHLSWYDVITNISNAIGKENVSVYPFESIKEVSQDEFFQNFLFTIGIKDTKNFMISEGVERQRGANRSYSALGMDIAKIVNPLLSKKEKKQLRNFLQTNFSTATHEKANLFTSEQRKRMSDYYREKNIKMFKEFMPKYDGDKLGYFDQTRIKPKVVVVEKTKVSITDNTDTITFNVRSQQQNVQIAFYLYKDDKRIDTQWYSTNFSYTLDKKKYGAGQYRVRYFIVDKKVKDPGKAKKSESGFSEYVTLQ